MRPYEQLATDLLEKVKFLQIQYPAKIHDLRGMEQSLYAYCKWSMKEGGHWYEELISTVDRVLKELDKLLNR